MRRLSIANPCSAPWGQMAGSSRSRHCATCDRTVHDLSARTEIEARALLALFGAGGLCVRFEVGADGAVLHAPAPKRRAPPPRAATGVVAAAALGVAACGPAAQAPNAPAVDLPPPPPGAAMIGPSSRTAAVRTAAPADLDRDGVVDDDDACPADPGRASPDPRQNGCPIVCVVSTQGEMVILEAIRFARGARAPAPEAQAMLDEIAKLLGENPDITKVAIEGHASGDEPNAKKLGLARAEAVATALAKLKVDPGRLVVESQGVARPFDSNATSEGRARNRRVEFRLLEVAGQAKSGAPTP